jgi:glutaredoxin
LGVEVIAHGHSNPSVSEALILEHAAAANTDFLVYTGHFCGYCRALKNLLNEKSLTYTEINFDEQPHEMRTAVVRATGHRTVPVVFDLRDNQPVFIGGFDETRHYLK